MNTDLHGWEAGWQARQESGAAVPHTGSSSSLSDPCSIRVSSVAQQSSTGHTTTSVTMRSSTMKPTIPDCTDLGRAIKLCVAISPIKLDVA